MKSLSKSLKKSYFIIILSFILLFIASLIVTGKYVIDVNKVKLRDAMSFLDYEIGYEKGDKTPEIFTGNLVKTDFKKENISLKNMDLIISSKTQEYSERKGEIFKNIDPDNKIKDLDIYEYLVLSKNIKANQGKILKVTLIKSLKKEKYLFIKIIEIFCAGLIITIIISMIGIKYFLNKIKYQLNILENINETIDLNNLKSIKPKNQFIEFENICLSYEKMLQRLDEQNQKQIEFVNNASHELKTPIFIIGGYIDMMKRWGKNNKEILDESINSVEDEVKNMTELIEKLLFIAKNKEVHVEKKEIELSEIIIEILSKFKIIYPKIKVNFNPEYVLIESDEGLIKLLLKNLIENAIKYSNGNPVSIYLNQNENNNTILTIIDKGIGMDLSEQSHIFDRFYRVSKSRDKNIKGHGLGMTIVKKIKEILNIDLIIESEKNRGTKVKIIF